MPQGTCALGVCSPASPSTCSNGLICDSTSTCKQSCTADSDCLTGNKCLPKSVGSADTGCPNEPPCGRDGTCDGLGACHYPSAGASCGSPTCSNGMLTAAGQCNGSGTCTLPTTSTACANHMACGSSTTCGQACIARCTTSCTTGYKCLDGGASCTPATVSCGSTSCTVGGRFTLDPRSFGKARGLTLQGQRETVEAVPKPARDRRLGACVRSRFLP